jgi:hypothetical protein
MEMVRVLQSSRRRPFLVRTLVLFVLPFVAPLGAFAAEQAKAQPGRFVNRSLITLGGDVYTSLDGRLLLVLWNALAEPQVPMVTNLESDPRSWPEADASAGGRTGGARWRVLSRYGPDTRRLLFVLLVWEESRRLGLFVPPEKALEELRTALGQSEFANATPVDVRRYWADMNQGAQNTYLNMIFRAKNYLRVRCDLDANPRLNDTPWFWHGMGEP